MFVLDAHAGGRIALRIEVDHQYPVADLGQRGPEADRSGRFSDPTLLVRDSHDPSCSGGLRNDGLELLLRANAWLWRARIRTSGRRRGAGRRLAHCRPMITRAPDCARPEGVESRHEGTEPSSSSWSNPLQPSRPAAHLAQQGFERRSSFPSAPRRRARGRRRRALRPSRPCRGALWTFRGPGRPPRSRKAARPRRISIRVNERSGRTIASGRPGSPAPLPRSTTRASGGISGKARSESRMCRSQSFSTSRRRHTPSVWRGDGGLPRTPPTLRDLGGRRRIRG